MLNLNNTYKENQLENIVAGGAGFIGSHLIDFLLKKKKMFYVLIIYHRGI